MRKGPEDRPVMVKMEHIHKQFSGVTVLDDVSLEVRPGEVHALAGGNGAGKSTLMKILQGIYQRDGGSIDIAGKSYESLNVASARKAGVGMVFQEFSLVPTMNIAQNIFMGAENLGTGHFLDKKDMRDRAVELLGRLGVDLDPDTEVGELATGYWQLTEIAKALRANARVLILDEPTASLSAAEIESFFALVRNLKRQGISLIYISHRMDEIRKIADRITILRNGRNLLTRDIGDITDEEIIEGIVGKPTETLARRERNGDALGQVLLDVHDLKSDKGLNGVTLQVRRGEVVGLAGLMGSGRTEVTRALFGIDRITSGEISMSGKPYHPKDPQDAMAASVALVPEDRREQGLIVSHSVAENLAITRLDECRSMGLLAGRKIAALADGLIKRFSVKVDSPRAPASRLSGGNQQKVVIAKWLGRDPDLLVMDEPTAGVDIGTKSEVLSRVTQFADSGKAVLFISSELAEMVAVCDRYIVMKHGSSVGELDGASIRDESELQLAIQHAGKTTNTAEQGNVIQEGKE